MVQGGIAWAPALIALLIGAPAAPSPERSLVGLTLNDPRVAERPLIQMVGDQGAVIAFLGTECPLARLYAVRLDQLAKVYEPRGVAFIALAPNEQDSLTDVLAFARSTNLATPFFIDANATIADKLGASRTPEVVLVDRQGRVRYQGRVDDQFSIGVSRPAPTREDLRDAIDNLLAGRAITPAVTEAPGCLIGRLRSTSHHAAVTWHGQVERIIQKHCQDCHRPGQVAPFSLLTHDDAAGWSAMMGEVVADGRMPPWHANPAHGEFANDARLSADEKKTILEWVAAGAPRGDQRQAPPPRAFTPGWQIDNPDQVVWMTETPYPVPADGVIAYQWFRVDPGFKENKWIEAVECRPGNPAVVHHVTVYFEPPGGSRLKLGERINLVGGFAPGKRPGKIPWDGSAKFIPAGSKFLFEMHYTTNGVAQTDRSSVALKFADPAKVKRQLSVVLVANDSFAIPPRNPAFLVQSSYTLDEDSFAHTLSPHMHLRGKSFRFEATYPDGTREVLLDVPKFDFNWQLDYQLSAPKPLPAGTRIECAAVFDNSEANLNNPDPSSTVRWGEQTWDEMMIGAITLTPQAQDLTRGLGHPVALTLSRWTWCRVATLLVASALALVAWRFLAGRRRMAAIAASIALIAPWPALAASPLGRRVDDVTLARPGGGVISLPAVGEKKLTVCAVLGVECPLARLYASRLSDLAKVYAPRGVEFIGVDANVQDTLAEIAAFAKENQLSFPLGKDTSEFARGTLGAKRTPEVFLLDRDRIVRYHGRVDDQFAIEQGLAVRRLSTRRHDLREAIDDLLAGRPPRVPETIATGCLIGKRPAALKQTSVTWSKDVAPIAQRKCQECHRPGEVAPFSMLDYADVVGWAETIAEAINDDRMPPWHANPSHGEFSNDCRLTTEERRTILEWIAAGAPEGNPAHLPAPRVFPNGWQIPTPDVVYAMRPEPFQLPADGPVQYQYFTVDPGFTEGKWIKAVECRPGNAAVVHHINVFVLPERLGDHYTRDDLTDFLISAYAPGLRTTPFPDGAAYFVPAGAKFVFQMHYQSIGVAQSDISQMGVVFTRPGNVRRRVEVALCVNEFIEAPPREPNYRVQAAYEFPNDAVLWALTPHMHLRGRSFRYEAFFPDGTSEILLDVPRFDFNWQTIYYLRESRTIPKGTLISCQARYDNSADNPFNPDPDRLVRWGDQASDEMMIGYMFLTLPKETASAIPVAKARRSTMVIAVAAGAGLVIAAGVIAWSLGRNRAARRSLTANIPVPASHP